LTVSEVNDKIQNREDVYHKTKDNYYIKIDKNIFNEMLREINKRNSSAQIK
jgi:hypothetical protein